MHPNSLFNIHLVRSFEEITYLLLKFSEIYLVWIVGKLAAFLVIRFMHGQVPMFQNTDKKETHLDKTFPEYINAIF